MKNQLILIMHYLKKTRHQKNIAVPTSPTSPRNCCHTTLGSAESYLQQRSTI